jgi:hypothetical protein
MIERTNVGKFNLVPEGNYTFTVLGRPEKIRTAKTSYRKWKLGITEKKLVTNEITVFLFPWESKELLLAVGGKEEGNEIVWDDEEVDQKTFDADLKHNSYKDNNGEDKIKYALSNCQESIPF